MVNYVEAPNCLNFEAFFLRPFVSSRNKCFALFSYDVGCEYLVAGDSASVEEAVLGCQ